MKTPVKPDVSAITTAPTPVNTGLHYGALCIIEVALDIPRFESFDFAAPACAEGDVPASEVDVGRLIVVPFGPRTLVGVIIAVRNHSTVPADKLKTAIEIKRDLPGFSALDFALFKFCASYYQFGLGTTILTAIPPRLRKLDAPIRALKPVKAKTSKAVAIPALNLTGDQAAAVATITARLAADFTDANPPILLEGITGSGKTEVYLRAIAQVLAAGKQALVLVPEINLTPQLERIFIARFPDVKIVSLHSSISETARYHAWHAAQRGEAQLVLGTRLAVFTPMPALALIVVDEEHDGSFKQQEGLRYHARDVAIVRAKLCGATIVLGSATPSLETYENALRAKYTHCILSTRANAAARLPKVQLLNTELLATKDGLTDALIAAVKQRIAKGEQSILFLNRRGFSPTLVCNQCEWRPPCPRCSAKLVFHQAKAKTDSIRDNPRKHLACHHCGYEARIPAICAKCGSPDITPIGQGTQRIEAAIEAAFPGARISRIDADSTSKKGSAAALFADIAAGNTDIIIGTQMLAKGHDFPKVTLVGIVNADFSLFSADFRAAERLFAQLVQVSGRAGRADLPGEVLIQTKFPEHPVYQAVITQNFAAFAQQQLAERKLCDFPPYAYLAILRAESKNAEGLNAWLTACVAAGRKSADLAALQLFDPVSSPLARKADHSRMQVLVQSKDRRALQQFLPLWRAEVFSTLPSHVRAVIDVDPMEV